MVELVGREPQMSSLRRLLDETMAGQGRIVFLSGEAGIGKTRLLREMESYAKKSGIVTLHGRWISPLGSDPYFPILEALKEYNAMRSKDEQRVPISIMAGGVDMSVSGGKLVPMGLLGIDNMFNQQTSDVHERIDRLWKLDVGRERDQTFESISSLVLDLAQESPLLLLLEDAQWADSATLNLLVHISRYIKAHRMLILCSYRAEEVLDSEGRPNILREAIRRIDNEKAYEHLTLEGLKKDETRILLSRLLLIPDVPAELVDVLHERTSGNPYFIEELVKDLVDQGMVVPEDRRWAAGAHLKDLALPGSVRDVIVRKLSMVEPRAMRTMEVASVIGKEFEFELLMAVVGADEEAMVDDLDHLIKSKLVAEEADKGRECYRFVSTVLRDAVYEGVSNVKRRMLHKKVASSIEALRGTDSTESVFDLAHHYKMAKEQGLSVKYLARAGDISLRSFALDEAIKHYRSALDGLRGKSLDRVQLSQKASILLSLGLIHSTIGELDTALKELDEVLSISRTIADITLEARAYVLLGRVHEQRSEIAVSLEMFLKSQALFKQTSDIAGEAMALQLTGHCHFRMGEYRKALELLEQSRAMAGKINSIGDLTTSTTLIAGVNTELGDFERSEEYYKMAEELGLQDGDPYKISRIYNNWADLRMREWRYADALPILEKALEPSKRAGNIRIMGYVYSNIAECLAHIGELERARPHVEKAKAIFEKLDEKLMTSRMIMIEGVMHRKSKAWDKARECGLKSIAIAEAIKIPFAVGEYTMEYGISLKEEGATEEALRTLQGAAGIFKDIEAGKFLEKTEQELGSLGGK